MDDLTPRQHPDWYARLDHSRRMPALPLPLQMFVLSSSTHVLQKETEGSLLLHKGIACDARNGKWKLRTGPGRLDGYENFHGSLATSVPRFSCNVVSRLSNVGQPSAHKRSPPRASHKRRPSVAMHMQGPSTRQRTIETQPSLMHAHIVESASEGIQTKHLLTRPQACPLTGA